jgi:L-lactate dehydrogenase (cytochrome)
VAEAQRRAKRTLPSSVYLAIVGGTEQGLTLADNVGAFDELRFRPRIADIPAERSQTTRILGQEISFPVLISPTGVQGVHPDGEVAVARAAAQAGTLAGLSSFASKPLQDVVAANPATFFQLYWIGSRDQIAARVERARAAGACAAQRVVAAAQAVYRYSLIRPPRMRLRCTRWVCRSWIVAGC